METNGRRANARDDEGKHNNQMRRWDTILGEGVHGTRANTATTGRARDAGQHRQHGFAEEGRRVHGIGGGPMRGQTQQSNEMSEGVHGNMELPTRRVPYEANTTIK